MKDDDRGEGEVGVGMRVGRAEEQKRGRRSEEWRASSALSIRNEWLYGTMADREGWLLR